MRHKKSGRKFGRKSGPRRALERSIVLGVLSHGRIVTTLPKAKEYRGSVERLITIARRGNAARDAGDGAAWLRCFRTVVAELGGNREGERVARILFTDIAPQFRDRNGGYTRVMRHWRTRLGDSAPQAVFELVGYTPAAEPAEEGTGTDAPAEGDAAGAGD